MKPHPTAILIIIALIVSALLIQSLFVREALIDYIFDALCILMIICSFISLALCLLYFEVQGHVRKNIAALESKTRELQEQKGLALQSAKMSALGEMVAGMAHEINTPLAAIKMFLSEAIYELDHNKSDSTTVINYLHKSDMTIDRISKIIKGLKTFSRSGEADPFQTYSVQEAIEDAMILCGDRFNVDGVDLRWEIPAETITIECRPVEITQVLLNLMGNALDAVSKLEQKWIELNVSHTPDFVQMRVTDSGPGIDPLLLEKIFQPFFTTKDVGKGTGIGLSVSMGIARGHNGRLFIDPGHVNTSFVIEIPKRQGLRVEDLSLEGVI
ncbi:ATP-binding protein [Bdellovibrio sp. ArHS]|uniref:sensor histidine kinase n=1 Tax=Bdellovibrio sp. ArHS TaxID=1569284 RepID=UPI000B261B11|nr:ATP-binding protein [Bdellovibrio sp. ArHS]